MDLPAYPTSSQKPLTSCLLRAKARPLFGVALVIKSLSLTLLTAPTASAQVNVYQVLAGHTQPEYLQPALDPTLASIVDRVAYPLTASPQDELRRLQELYLDLDAPDERRFLDLARRSTARGELFVVTASSLARDQIVREGRRYNINEGTYQVMFTRSEPSERMGMVDGQEHIVPTIGTISRLPGPAGRQQPTGTETTGVRRDPMTGATLGVLYDNRVPISFSGVWPRDPDSQSGGSVCVKPWTQVRWAYGTTKTC